MTANMVSIPSLRWLIAQRMTEILNTLSRPLALIGLIVILMVGTLISQPQLSAKIEAKTLVWLLNRFENRAGMPSEPEAIDRVSALNPKELPSQQANVALWLSKKYRVAPEPIGALVAEAYELGKTTKIDPSLLLAVMAVESSFNPFAQSSVGAQGLMQVMTKVHTEKFQGYGGNLAAFDPVSNLRVGAKVLQDCIARAGSVTGGLKFYVGAALLGDDGGYSEKVFAEQRRLLDVAAGRSVSTSKPLDQVIVKDDKLALATVN
jgi:soluble lytic murein transglycosylase-like protein